MKKLIIAIVLISPCLGDVSHLLSKDSTTTTPPPPPRPYNFQYHAERYPGRIDRVHQENGDGAGHIQGSYSFIDPKHKLRTVQYTADETGFHASLINYEDTITQPVDSEAVKLAKEKHHRLYQKIAEAHSHGTPADLPRDSTSVGRAKARHNQLYQKIAQEHAVIAAQREAERLAYEATSVVNDVNPNHAY
ncbi:uncharacterized protein LOC128892403 [Hylaeus anthracinus]|uniref:uncharacterized protein LOC128892403 n=1 Tax=Hylaeus anthracinus TaxID=313031 RepID=UPI0023B8CE7E|nr:uncharacterized protein LOC128892403 [Hylaeus anthracinus]